MKSQRDVENSIQDMELDTHPAADQRVLQDVLQAQASQRRLGLFTLAQGSMLKRAVAALVLVGIGCALARWAQTPAVDTDALTQQVVASMQASMRAEIQTQVRDQLSVQGQTDGELEGLAQAVYEKIEAELATATRELLTAYDARTEARLLYLAQEVKAARQDDRRWMMAVLERFEAGRLQDKQQFRTGLMTLAARTYELMDQERPQSQTSVH